MHADELAAALPDNAVSTTPDFTPQNVQTPIVTVQTDPTDSSPTPPIDEPTRNPPSEALVNAARQNGALSRGPKTEAGKARSRQNALKHGLSGEGAVLPEQIREAYLAEIELFQRDLHPRNHLEFRLIERAALATTRWLFLMRSEIQSTTVRVLHAEDDWVAKRRADVARLARVLEPESKEDPAEAVAELRRTSAGCLQMVQGYSLLIDLFQTNAPIQAQHATRLMRLCGHPHPYSRDNDPPAIRNLWDCVLAINIPTNPYLLDVTAQKLNLTSDELWERIPTPEDARKFLLDYARSQRKMLLRRARRLARNLDAPCRAGARDERLFDDSPSAFAMNRYLVDNSRIAHAAISQFSQLRKQARSNDDEAGTKWDQTAPQNEPNFGATSGPPPHPVEQ